MRFLFVALCYATKVELMILFGTHWEQIGVTRTSRSRHVLFKSMVDVRFISNSNHVIQLST
jgi:hypothetical protein